MVELTREEAELVSEHGSLSSAATADALLELADEGKIEFDDEDGGG